MSKRDASLEDYRPRWLRSALLTSVGAALALTTLPVKAQTAGDEAQSDAAEVEEITVTGSRIARTDLTSMSPVSVVQAEEFRLSGTTNVEELLNTLPQVVPGFTGASNNPGGGFTTINLRGLGSNRNLVLVNGRRFVPSTQGGTVDINNIPSGLIERVEVVTGGASAVYGSDAISGVVNFILKDNFEGAEASYQYRITEQGDGDIHNFNVLMGGNFADGRGNAVVFANYQERKPIFAAARPYTFYALGDDLVDPGTLNKKFGYSTPCSDPTGESCVIGLVKSGSSGIPGTRVFGGPRFDSNGDGVIDSNDSRIGRFGPSGDPQLFRDPQDRYNYAPVNFIQIPLERWTLTGNARYEIVPELLNVFFEGNFVNSRSPQELAPTPAFVGGLEVDVDSPFFSPATQQALQNADDDEDGFVSLPFIGRRMIEVGPRQSLNEFNTYRFVIGFDGTLPGDWNWSAFYSFGRVQATNLLNNDVSEKRFRQAIKTTFDDNGNLVCSDPSGGCVPLNIFGEGNISQAAADFVRVGAANVTTIQEQVANVSVTGDLWDLGAGPIGVAYGFEYRAESSEFRPDEFLSAGDVLGFNAGQATKGRFDLWELFMETIIPVIEGVPGVERLQVSGALRFSDYSLQNVGTVWTYSGGGDWTVIPGVTFRGQFQRAIRAPSIVELFQGISQGFPPATDPCAADNTPDPVAAGINDLCLAQGVPDSDGDGVIDPFGQANSQIEGSFGGNPLLQEERANTWTLGAVLQPDFAPGLNIIVDYYNISVDGFISTRAGGVNNIISECFRIGDPNSVFCQSITRRPDGNIDVVDAVNDNLLNLKTKGIDLQIDYVLDMANIGLEQVGGTLSFTFAGTYVINNSFQTIITTPRKDCAGFFGPTCGEPDPQWRHTMRTTYSNGPAQVSLRWRYIGSVDDFDGGFPNSVGSENYFDLSFTYQFTEYLTVYGGVDNLSGNKPPLIGDSNEQSNTYPSTYDVLGRRFFIGATASF